MLKKLLAVVLAVVMMVPSMQLSTFAQDVEGTEAAETEVSTQGTKIVATTTKKSSKYYVTFQQKEMNYRTVTVSVPNVKKLLESKTADQVKVSMKMYYGDKVRQTKTKKVKLKDIKSNPSFGMKVPYFGKYKVTTTLYKKGKKVKTLPKVSIGVIAEKYNIVAMNATTPVLIFALKCFDLCKDGETPIPTITSVSRYWQFDWNKLPENLYQNPLLTAKQDHGGSMKWDGANGRLAALKDYVKQLYTLDKNAKFTFYVNDYNLDRSLMQIYYENKIPEDNATVRILTDGSASYSTFHATYNVSNATEKHAALVEDLKEIRQQIYDGKKLDYSKLKYGTITNYEYAFLDVERDAQWWLVRKSKDTLAIDADESGFLDSVIADSRVTSNYINNLLATVQSAGNEAKFKALYKFDDSAFKQTRKNGKKIMMVLGTSKSGEDADPVSDYARFLIAYYGDDFEFYYKGHPGYITEKIPERVEMMKSMGMQILESSIAAELFVFYNPDMYFSGYQSSTFQNAGTEENCAGLFNISKAAAFANTNLGYADKMDFFMSNLTKHPDLLPEDVKADLGEEICANSLFLVEFQDGDKYEIAIWDSTTSSIYFYNTEDGKYVRKEERIGVTPVVPTVKQQEIKKVTPGKKKLTVSYKKNSKATGYEIVVARNSSFTKSAKTVKVSNNTTTKKTIKKLKSKKTYYVKVRSYKISNGVVYYGKYSAKKKVKVK